MKKYLLAAALVMASTSALADRVASSKTDVNNIYVRGTKAEACQSAKDQVRYNQTLEEIEGYSKCECDMDSSDKWICTVDAKVVKK